MQMNLESQNKEIVAEVKQAIASGSLGEWVEPWISKGMPTNLSTGRIYSGMWNQRILHKAFSQRIFRAHSWATFSQIRKIGGRVLKGEHGVGIIMPKVITEKSPDETDENRQMYFRSVAVFNIEQTNLKLSDYFVDPKPPKALNQDEAYQWIKAIKHRLKGTENAPAYDDNEDAIHMPAIDTFATKEDYFASYFHELGHWTRHKDRLNRGSKYKDPEAAYAFEELVAELSSAYVTAFLGYKTNLQHKEYIQWWYTQMEAEPAIISRAGALASRAFNYLANFAPDHMMLRFNTSKIAHTNGDEA